MQHRHASRSRHALLALAAGSAFIAGPSSLAGAQTGIDSFRVFDLNGDGLTDNADYLAWDLLRSQNDPRADLDGDRSINAEDERLARRSADSADDPGPFTYHWSLREEYHTADFGDAPIVRDTEFYPQFEFGKYPKAGYQEMMADEHGNVSRWRVNYERWMSEHLAIVEAEIRESQQENPNFRYGAIDYENSMPVWSFIQRFSTNHYADWRLFLATLHRSAFDEEFLDRVGFTPPAGAHRWADLDGHGRLDLARVSWNHFGQDFYMRTLRHCRDLAPGVKWGMFNVPKYNIGIRVWQDRRDLNDDFGWLLSELDFFAPSFYRAPFVWQGPSGCNTDEPTKLMQWYQANIEEMMRLRDVWNPDAEIFGYVFAHYHPGTCPGQRMPAARISDENLRAAVMYTRLFGADGLMIWHPLPRVPHPDKPWLNAQQLGAEMSNRWAPILRDWRSGLAGVTLPDGGDAASGSAMNQTPTQQRHSKQTRTAGVSTISGGIND